MNDLPTNPSESTKRRNPELWPLKADYVFRTVDPSKEEETKEGWDYIGPVRPLKRARMEEDIHDDIKELCKARGWYIVHSRMDKPTTVQVGTPDFIIALPKRPGDTHARVLWIECKRPGKKPTDKQRERLCWLRKLGHEAHVVVCVEQVETLASNP